MKHPRRLSASSARRIALSAQGFGREPQAPSKRHIRTVIARLGLLQLDTVNVFERSHYLPLLARLGAYNKADLDALVHHAPRPQKLGPYTEAWAHEAAIIPVSDWPLMRHRHESFRNRYSDHLAHHGDLANTILAAVRDRGPSKVSGIDHPANVTLGGGWWNKNPVHETMHALFRTGDLVVVGRSRFERVYDLAERVIPSEFAHAVPRTEAHRELMARAARALGVATLDDLRDYYRLPYLAEAKQAARELEDMGVIERVDVAGWNAPAYLHRDQTVPRTMDVTALLSPFDPIVWHRPRALRLSNFAYKISIYTPAPQRVHGYYVLPVLVGDSLVGRIDLKSDRQSGVLRVQHANIESARASEADMLAERIAPRIWEAAAWQGLDDVVVAGNGDWASALTTALAAHPTV